MAVTNPQSFDADIKNIIDRPITQADITYLKEKIGFVHIEHGRENAPIKALKPEEDCNDYQKEYPFIIPTDTAWILKYYPRYETNPTHAEMTGSWGMEFNAEADDDVSLQHIKLQDKFRAVMEMVNFCKSQGWLNIAIVDGTYFMKWAVWAYCDYLQMPVSGYDPTDDDKTRQTTVSAVMLKASQAFIRPYIPSLDRVSISVSSDTGDDAKDE